VTETGHQGPGLRIDRRKVLFGLDIAAVAVLAVWLAVDLLGKPLFGSAAWPEAVDYTIVHGASRFIVAHHDYPGLYPYPPPAVVLQFVTAVFPLEISAAIWLAVIGVAAAVSYWIIGRILDLRFGSGLMPVLVLAQLAGAYAIQWDIRSVNTNLVVLATVLLGVLSLVRRREISAGCWFALAVALKIIPVLLIAYLAWTRRYKAFVSAMLATIALWIILPLVVFMPAGAVSVYRGWVSSIMLAASPDKATHPILISVWKAADAIRRTNAASATAIVLSLLACWIVLGVVAAISARNAGLDRSNQAILGDVGILILGPAVLSTYLEPYHVVGMIIPAAVVAYAAINPGAALSKRLGAAIAFLVALMGMQFSSFELRGLSVNGEALVLCWAAFLCAGREAIASRES